MLPVFVGLDLAKKIPTSYIMHMYIPKNVQYTYVLHNDGKQNVYRNYIMHIKMAYKRMNVCLPLFQFNEGVETPAMG